MTTLQKSKKQDMTQGSIGDKILKFSLPLAATGILQQLFNAADIAVVGRFVGADAMAAVGANSSLVGLMVGLFTGLGLGSNVIIARAIGGRDSDTVKKAVHTSILLALIAGFFVLILGELFAVGILRAQNVPEEVLPTAIAYLRIYLIGMPVILLYNFEAAIFRATGNTQTPLLALMISGVINVALNLFFVVVCHMSADGVALATVIANLISSMVLFVFLCREKSMIHVDVHDLRIDRRIMGQILRIGVPAGIQSAVFSFANIIIQSAINTLGATTMAASSAAYNLEVFAYYVLNSFGQACTTFTGQNNGAGKPERCKKALLVCLLQDGIATAIVIAIILLFGRNLLAIFNQDPEIISIGYVRLQYIFFAYIFSTPNEVLSGYLRGYGISMIPALISIVGICGTRLLWIFFVFPQSPTFATIMTVYPISLGVTALAIFLAILILRPARNRSRFPLAHPL